MDFLTDQHQHAPVPIPLVAGWAIHPNIVIGNDNGVQSRSQRSLGDLSMAGVAIGIVGVHMQIDNDFVHALVS